jgi:hypothetical protein
MDKVAIAMRAFRRSDTQQFVRNGQKIVARDRYIAELARGGLVREVAMLPDPPEHKQPDALGRWPGSVIVCIASGPSLTIDDVSLVEEWRTAPVREPRRVIVVNTTYKAAPWADVLYACDAAWWNLHIQDVRESFAGEPWTLQNFAAKKHRLHEMPSDAKPGLGRKVMHLGGNSGYQAVNMAYLFGARRIILLGYDMQRTGGRSHWHGDHPKGLRNTSPFASWIARFKVLAKDLREAGVEAVNATRETALLGFERVDLREALRLC